MHRFAKFGAFTLAALGLFACGGTDENIDQAMLAQYRKAVPSKEQLAASAPEASIHAKVGEPALYPTGSQDIVLVVNGAVTGIIDGLKKIVDTEPTIYNSETKEFFWGPYKSEDSFGTVAAYIKDAGEGEDFRYQYALLRGASNDVNTMKPVIWGGANPDPGGTADHGSGITLWDFEANYAFEQANNPDAANVKLDRGRFIAVYAKGANDKGTMAFVVGALRNFVPKENPQNPAANLDYFWGGFDDKTNRFDFIDWASSFDVDKDPAKPAAENVTVHMAFLNEGTGRAEVVVSGGDLAMGQTGNAVECWDKALAETYLSFETQTNNTPDGPAVTEGLATDCGVFQPTLKELGVPSLQDIDASFLGQLDEVAKNGVPQ